MKEMLAPEQAAQGNVGQPMQGLELRVFCLYLQGGSRALDELKRKGHSPAEMEEYGTAALGI
ncbi:MAG: hypothetical protein Q9183_004545, partial [Haloplaca sp. 2 TL-2023]